MPPGDKSPLDIQVSINLRDVYKLAQKLNLVDAFKAGVKAAAKQIQGIIKEYPPATEANLPGPYPKRWYQRGYGPFWTVKGGKVKLRVRKGVTTATGAGVRSKRTSQILGKKWTVRMEDKGLTAVIGNAVTYAPYVHDAEHQAPFHKRRGWLTIQTVAEDELDGVRKLIHDSIIAEAKRKGLL